MRVHQVGGTGFLDVEKVILCGNFTQWHDFDAVWFPTESLEKQVIKVAGSFRVAHRLTQRFDVGRTLRRVRHTHDIACMLTVLIMLASERRCGFIPFDGITHGERYLELTEKQEDNESFVYGWMKERVSI